MSPSATKNIKAAFDANPQIDEFHSNEFGHCFKSPGEGLTIVTRAENADAFAKVEADELAAAKKAAKTGDDNTAATGGETGPAKTNGKKK